MLITCYIQFNDLYPHNYSADVILHAAHYYNYYNSMELNLKHHLLI